jgi:hypothetical protein
LPASLETFSLFNGTIMLYSPIPRKPPTPITAPSMRPEESK